MAIKVARKIQRTPIPSPAEQKTKPEEKKKKKSTLPPDAYKDEIPPKDILLSDNGKLVVSVKRGGEFGTPCVDIRYFATTDRYTGFTKKGVTVPLEFALDVVEALREAVDECAERGIE